MQWYSYLMGYLIVIIEGSFPEKVINMALTRGISLWDIKSLDNKKIMLKIQISSFKALRHIVKSNSCKMKIHKRVGLPFKFSWVKRRKGLIYGLILFVVSLYILSSFVWFIEITGLDNIEYTEIKELVQKHGIKEGANIHALDLDDLEIKIAENHPGIAWVGLEQKGTKISIKIAEKSLIPKTEDDQKGHLIAMKKGTIEEMLVLQGTPLVEEGDSVNKGQMLVSGYVYPEIVVEDDGTQSFSGDPELVKAKGVVRASVEYNKRASFPFEKEVTIKTGNKIEQIVLKYKDNSLVIKGPKEMHYKHYTKKTRSTNIIPWRKNDNSIEILSHVYYEQIKENKKYGPEEAFNEAVKKAEEDLKKQLPEGIETIDREINLHAEKDNAIEVEVIWKCIHNIAKPLPDGTK